MSTPAQNRFYHGIEIYYMISGILGFLGAFSVLLTGFMFRPLRREIFFQLILLTSVCDLLVNVTIMWGTNRTQDQCTLQAFSQVFFFLSSIMFVLMVCVTMFSHLQFQKQYLHLWHMIAISLFVALTLALLPLSNPVITYVAEYNYDEGVRCFLSVKKLSDDDHTIQREDDIFKHWVDGIFLVPIIVLTGVMALLCTWLYVITVPSMDQKKADRILPLVNYIMTYPCLMAILFLPSAIYWLVLPRAYGMGDSRSIEPERQAEVILTGGRFFYGALVAIVFFYNSSSAREFWKLWFIRHIGSWICGYEEENPLLKGLTAEELRDSRLTRARALTMMRRYTGFANASESKSKRSIKSIKSERSDKSSYFEEEEEGETEGAGAARHQAEEGELDGRELTGLDISLLATFVDPVLEMEKMRQSRTMIDQLRSWSRSASPTGTTTNDARSSTVSPSLMARGTTLSRAGIVEGDVVENPLSGKRVVDEGTDNSQEHSVTDAL